MEETKNPLGIDEEVKERVAQEQRLKNIEQMIKQKADDQPADGEKPVG